MRIGLIGVGRLGRAIIKGLVARDIDPKQIYVYDISTDALKIAEALGINIANSSIDVVQRSDIVIIAVKPKQVEGVVKEISEVASGKTVVSVAAFVPLKKIEKYLTRSRVFRAMPNIAVEVNSGLIALTPRERFDRDIDTLFKKLGETLWIDEEILDLLTLMSASTPALIAEIADVLILASLKMGIPHDIARKTVSQLLQGIGKMLLEKDVSSIRDSVITPRGVTIELIERFYTTEAKTKLLQTFIETIDRYTTMLKEFKNYDNNPDK